MDDPSLFSVQGRNFRVKEICRNSFEIDLQKLRRLNIEKKNIFPEIGRKKIELDLQEYIEKNRNRSPEKIEIDLPEQIETDLRNRDKNENRKRFTKIDKKKIKIDLRNRQKNGN